MYKTNFDFIVDKAKTAEKPIRVAIAGADCENITRFRTTPHAVYV